MNPYPGVAPLTVNTSGIGGPGIIVSGGGTDPHGSWPTPVEVTGNDNRTSGNTMSMGEGLTDRDNWLGWRVPDYINGGDYRSLFVSQVQMATPLVLDRSGLLPDGFPTLILFGVTGRQAIQAYAGSGNENCAEFTGSGNGTGLATLGGASGPGLVATSGASSPSTVPAGKFWGPGGALDPCVEIVTGLLRFSGAQPAPTDAVPANHVSAKHIAKCWGHITSNGSASPVIDEAVNVASVVLSTSGLATMQVVFATPMANTNYHVEVQINYSSGVCIPAQITKGTTAFTVNVFANLFGFSTPPSGPGSITGEYANSFGSGLEITFSVHAKQ